MARKHSPQSAEDVILQTVEEVAQRVSASISRAVADIVAARIEEELRKRAPRGLARPAAARPAAKARKAAAPKGEVTRWVPDRKARRVPRFVIEMTGGLDTKKAIAEKFGEEAVFEKGQPLPEPK